MAKDKSEQIASYFTFKLNIGLYEIKIKGRAQSVLGAQGAHVTPYGLVAHGIEQALTGILADENYVISDPRKQRGRFYNFISSIAALNPDKQKDLYKNLNKQLEIYNKKRTSKKELFETYTELKKLKDDHKDTYKKGKKLIQTKLENNNRHICEAMSEMAAVILTFYNKIPKTAYLKIEGFAKGKNEGAIINKSLRDLKIAAKKPKKGDIDNITSYLVTMLDYPEINDKKSLKKHEAATEKLKISTKEARTNDENDLVTVLSRHLHIAFAAFPKLRKLDEEFENKLSKKFITKVLKKWEKFEIDDYKNIIKKVIKKVAKLKALSKKEHYTKNDEYDDLASSEYKEKWVDKIKKDSNVNVKKI